MSRATRAAICSRVKRFIAPPALPPSCRGARGRHHTRRGGHLDDALDEDARRSHGFGIEIAEIHHLAYLGDRALRRARHDRPEVARGLAIDEIAPPIPAQRAD